MSYRDEFTEEANRKMTDPEWAVIAARCLKRLQNEEFGEIGRVLLQADRRFNASITDAYWFMQAYTLIFQTGQIAIAHIRIGAGPASDSEMADNQARLQRAVSNINALFSDGVSQPIACPHSFKVNLSGGPGDNDGFIEWTGALPFQVYRDGKFSHVRAVEGEKIPMEVGTTHIATTVQHFLFDRSVARWPYDSEWLTLLKVIDDGALRAQFRPSIQLDSPSRINNARC